jgi:hypothetical protein
MSTCKVCNKAHSRFLMNNRLVCMECDELTFDIEIESEDFEPDTQKPQPTKDRAPVQKRAKHPAK